MNKGTEEDKIFGPTLFREETFIGSNNRLDDLLDVYVNLKVNKLYGLSLKEFLELPKIEIIALKNHAIKTIDKQEEDLEDVLTDT